MNFIKKINRITQFSIFIVGLLSLSACSAFGKDPEGKHLEKIQSSPHFDKEKDSFVKSYFDKAFWISCGLAILGWILIYLIWGEYTTADIIGMLFAVPILAYLIHVIMLFNEK